MQAALNKGVLYGLEQIIQQNQMLPVLEDFIGKALVDVHGTGHDGDENFCAGFSQQCTVNSFFNLKA